MVYYKSEVTKIQYASRAYTSGLTDILISVWDPDNTAIATNQAMTELSTTGIYYFEFTPEKQGNYIYKISCATKQKIESKTIRVINLIRATSYGGSLLMPKDLDKDGDKNIEEILNNFLKKTNKIDKERKEELKNINENFQSIFEKVDKIDTMIIKILPNKALGDLNE